MLKNLPWLPTASKEKARSFSLADNACYKQASVLLVTRTFLACLPLLYTKVFFFHLLSVKSFHSTWPGSNVISSKKLFQNSQNSPLPISLTLPSLSQNVLTGVPWVVPLWWVPIWLWAVEAQGPLEQWSVVLTLENPMESPGGLAKTQANGSTAHRFRFSRPAVGPDDLRF